MNNAEKSTQTELIDWQRRSIPHNQDYTIHSAKLLTRYISPAKFKIYIYMLEDIERKITVWNK